MAAIPAGATPEEAAAIVAALERFLRATAAVGVVDLAEAPEPWARAAILEAVERSPPEDLRDPWINT